ncbi:MAG TPA: energy transducer TonB [Blastocatellia bacterium]|nr:energy transducer TonB [Blastocatellia bacterium]
MQQRALFADAFLSQPSIFRRLMDEFSEASSEFTQNPKAYMSSAIKGDGLGGKRRQTLLMYGLAIAILLFATIFVAILVAWQIANWKAQAETEEAVEYVRIANPDDFKMQDIEMPKADKKAGGGGGGGRNQPTPPSQGQLPKFSLTPPIIAPTTAPQLRAPSLPVMETVQVDPRLEKPRDDLAVTGLPTGVPGPPSDGPGSGGGIGTGKGGGVGSGDGTGVGPGRGYNMGGGGPQLGGGTGVATAVDVRPMALNRPRPNYTEEARKNKIQGVVLARLLIGADGAVKQVRITRGLPDGLNEEAIRAAYQIRFKPAMKSGQPVAFWQGVEIEFNLR